MKKIQFGYGDELSCLFIVFTPILALNIGYTYNNLEKLILNFKKYFKSI